MRRTLVFSSMTALAVAGPLLTGPAVGTVVDGNRFGERGISVLAQGCTDPATAPNSEPALEIVRPTEKPRYGEHAVRWVPETEGYGVGPLIHIAHPTDLWEHSVTVYSPNALSSPVAVATFVEPGREGIWKGRAVLPDDTTAGWHDVIVGAEIQYQWVHYDEAGAQDDNADSAMTLINFVNDRGGDNEGASVGVLFGCEGDRVLFDAIKVESGDGGSQLFNFEGTQTRTILKSTKSTITRGQKAALRVDLRTKAQGKRIDGTVTITAKKHGSSKFTRIATKKTGGDGSVSLSVRPTKTTVYRVSYAGTATVDGSTSSAVRIKVRAR